MKKHSFYNCFPEGRWYGKPKLNPDLSPAVIKMINFIGSHLKENITLMDIARAAGYSQFHALRIFNEETGLSPLNISVKNGF